MNALGVFQIVLYLVVLAASRLINGPKEHKRRLVVDTRHLESGATEVFVASRDEAGTTPDRIKWSREVDDDDIELRIALEDARDFKRQFER